MSTVDDIKARLDIVETVSGYVALQKSGRNFKARCPFHTEKTPSFVVNAERQSWRCFGACATGGDVFSFVMRIEGLDFGDALRLLAQKTGVALERGRDPDRNDTLYRINHVAARFYQDVLASARGRRGMEYLEGRGVNAEVRSRFEMGLSPDSWDALKSYLLTHEFTIEQAVEAGLVHRADNGNTWDFFRGRLMFPIHDRRSRVVGFGARALDGSMPKYLNTPRTPIFDKRSTLYGFHLAADAISAQDAGVVVEGYMDVVAAHQYDYQNVVASMGTALTEQQVSQLKSRTKNIVLALDQDAAGQEATHRDLTAMWTAFQHQVVNEPHRSLGTLYRKEQLNLKVAVLPAGHDPDDLIREDAREWDRLTRKAIPFMEYYISTVSGRFDLNTPQGKAQVVEVLAPMIASVDFIEQEHYVRALAETLDVSQEALKASMGGTVSSGRRRNRSRSGSNRGPKVSVSPLAGSPEGTLEDFTLALLLSKPALKERVREFAAECFHKSEDREVFTRWLGCPTIDDLRGSLDESLHEHLLYLTQKEMVPADRQETETALAQCLQRLERRHLQGIQESLLASEDIGVPPPREIEDEIAEVNARIRETFTRRTLQA